MRHVLSRPLLIFFILLVMTIILPQFALNLADGAKPLPAAYCPPDKVSEDSERLCALFDDSGLVAFSDDQLMAEEICSGRLSMGVVIPDDFSQRLESGRLEGILTLLEGRSSEFDALEKTEIAAALYQVTAPYFTERALAEAGFDFNEEDVMESYYSMVDSGQLFSFELRSTDGAEIQAVSRLNVFKQVLGLMLWICMFLGICIPLTKRARTMRSVIGRKKTLESLAIPSFVIAFVLLFVSAAISCAIAGYTAVILPSLITMALMGFAGLCICLAFPGGHICTLVCVFLAALVPALCPGLSDLALTIPVIDKVRVICPVYWLWLL